MPPSPGSWQGQAALRGLWGTAGMKSWDLREGWQGLGADGSAVGSTSARPGPRGIFLKEAPT